jgi:hypothetical protein
MADVKRVITFCEICNAEMPAGRFCGECGSQLIQKELEAEPDQSGGDASKPAGGLSIFEQNAIASQKAASSVSTVRDHKFAGAQPSAGYCGTFGDDVRKKAQEASSSKGGYNKFGGASSGYTGGFGDDQRKKAQEATSARGGYNKFGGASSGYAGGFGDEQRKKAQEATSARGGYNKFGGQKPVGGGIDMVTAHNLEKQKMMSEASRAKDSIVMSTEKKSEGGIDMVTAHNLEKQKMASEASRAKDSIVMSTEKKSEGAMDIYTASALKQQKETSSALKRQDKMIKTAEGTGEAPQVGEVSYCCPSCNVARPAGKFCQECGTPLIVA